MGRRGFGVLLLGLAAGCGRSGPPVDSGCDTGASASQRMAELCSTENPTTLCGFVEDTLAACPPAADWDLDDVRGACGATSLTMEDPGEFTDGIDWVDTMPEGMTLCCYPGTETEGTCDH